METITIRTGMAVALLVATAVLSSGVTFLVTHYQASQATVAVPAPTQGAAPPIRLDRGARF